MVYNDAWMVKFANAALLIGWSLTELLIGYLSAFYAGPIMIISTVLLF